MTATAAELLNRIRRRQALIGVVGLGYVGLPLARAWIDADFRCLGFDRDESKIEKLLRGESYIGHLSAEWITKHVSAGRFLPTADMTRAAEADALLLCVPTPITPLREPDLQYVEGTARQIAAALRPGQLIVLDRTTYPGTTRDVVKPILESGGLKCGRDFWLAYSPEREDPGNTQFGTQRIPKVVGGVDDTARALAVALYEQIVVQVVPVADCETAEACKLLENVYRAVNIAMVNELKLVFDRLGIDIWKVIEAAKTKPFGFQAFYPGPGMGGHCIPVDPFYLGWIARQHGATARFIELAGDINAEMPGHVLAKTAEALASRGKSLRGSRVLLLGIAYKKDIDDPRESPAFRLFQLLAEAGATAAYHDPHIPRLPAMRHYPLPPLESQALTAEVLREHDVALIVTDHSAVDYRFVVQYSPLVVDTRNATRDLRAGRTNVVLA